MENNSSRRDFIKKSALLSTGIFMGTSIINSSLAANTNASISSVFHDDLLNTQEAAYTLPKLPYSYDALEPHIDKLTMEIHYSKHHQAYVTNLNKAIETLDKSIVDKAKSLSSIFENMNLFPEAIRNNGGGHYNHSLFWNLMKPNGGGEPKGKLGEAIITTFGSFDAFKKQFADAAAKRFGSGWAWLVVSNGKLTITSTPNQDNPLMNLPTIVAKGKPVLALDVWEHAYYLKNQNRRADYIASFWNVVNWDTAESLFIS
ncbi:superoxide dismutase [Flavobacterium succinicans]|uniref:Superoxide dismutase n=1 Tax=Flavobacterium succinicans TaxID=29536 RepID=A0A199XS77_9FLAO|nr:superoxide dismutase [Flavobacterium succinicans]OAZ04174.1 superoxide dismutase [Flavobacterium succinicans]